MKCYSCGYLMEDNSLKCKNCGFVHPGYTGDKSSYETILAQMGEEYQKKNHISQWKGSNGLQGSQSHEESYDVFICYKEVDEQGNCTQDSMIAKDVYEHLVDEGFRVYFESSTIAGVSNALVFTALNSSSVMLCIGTEPDYFNSMDVKWEWSFYLNSMIKGNNKILIPCYKDMNYKDLPREFANLPAQDMSRVNFLTNVTRDIRKVLEKLEQQSVEKSDELKEEVQQKNDFVDKKDNLKNEKKPPKNTPKPKNKKEDNRKSHKALPVAIATLSIAIIAISLLVLQVVIPNNKYKAAVELKENGQYEEAIRAFEEVKGYKDSGELIETGSAIEVKGYKDSGEQIAECEAAKNGTKVAKKYAEPTPLPYAVPTWVPNPLSITKPPTLDVDSVDEIVLNKTSNYKDAEIGDVISFGSYEQDGYTSNGKEDIEWLVLDKVDDRLLLLSKYGLDCKPYNSYAPIYWENSLLCKWLNNDFINNAFSDEERTKIRSTNTGNQTSDFVFLLSCAQAYRYFSTSEERKCIPTEFAIKQDAYTSEQFTVDGKATSVWWLRPSSYYNDHAAVVLSDGTVYDYGIDADVANISVRPALWLNIES